MKGDFDRMFPILMDEERGRVNNPKDPGGDTNFGITWPTLKNAIEKGLVPETTTIANLTPELAKAIYKPMYWDAVKGDQLPWPLCCYVFDSAVNQGITNAIKMLQRAMDVAQDGLLGPVTLSKAVARCATPRGNRYYSARFMAFRDFRYHGTRNFDVFGEGWIVRCFELAMQIN